MCVHTCLGHVHACARVHGRCARKCVHACMGGMFMHVCAHMHICVHTRVHACTGVGASVGTCMHVGGVVCMCLHACMCVHVFSWLEPIWPLPSFPWPCFLPAEGLRAARDLLHTDHATWIAVERNSFLLVKPCEGVCPCSQMLFLERWQQTKHPRCQGWARGCRRDALLQGPPAGVLPGALGKTLQAFPAALEVTKGRTRRRIAAWGFRPGSFRVTCGASSASCPCC